MDRAHRDQHNVRRVLNRTESMTAEEYNAACERGRILAVRAMLGDPARRKRVEEVYGQAYTRNRYPELYASTRLQ